MSITKLQLSVIAKTLSEPKLSIYLGHINTTMDMYSISTLSQKCMFLAQIMHESAACYYTKELASGKAYDTGSKAASLGNTPEADGDGQKYKGRGLIQITGLSNYRQLSKDFKVDFVANPSLLESPEWATKSAGWFWDYKNLNKIAINNTEAAFLAVTRKINGGTNGLADRKMYWEKAKKALGLV